MAAKDAEIVAEMSGKSQAADDEDDFAVSGKIPVVLPPTGKENYM